MNVRYWSVSWKNQTILVAFLFVSLFVRSNVFADTIGVYCYIYDPGKPETIAVEKPLYNDDGHELNLSAQWDQGYSEYIISPIFYDLLMRACHDIYPGKSVYRLTGKKIIQGHKNGWQQSLEQLSKKTQFIGTSYSGLNYSNNILARFGHSVRSLQVQEALTYIFNTGSVHQVVPGISDLASGKYKAEMHLLTKLNGIYRYKFSDQTDMEVSPGPGSVSSALEDYLPEVLQSDWEKHLDFTNFFLDKPDHLAHINPQLDFLSPQTILDFNRMKVRILDMQGHSVYTSEEMEAGSLENMSVFAFRPFIELYKIYKPVKDHPQNLAKRIRLFKLISWILHTRTQGFDSSWQIYSQELINAAEPRTLTSMANIGNTCHYFYSRPEK